MGRVWIFDRARRSTHMESERASRRGVEAEGDWNSALMMQRRVLCPTLGEAGILMEPLAEP